MGCSLVAAVEQAQKRVHLPSFLPNAASLANVLEGLKAGFRYTLTEWPRLEKPPFAAGPIDDGRADKVAVDNAEPEVGFREFRYSVYLFVCATSKRIPIIRLDTFIRMFIVVHSAPERITTSHICPGCHRPLLNAVHICKEFLPRIAAWKGRIWHRLAEEFA